MAIHDDYPGIEVTVQVNGQDLTEYATENDESKHENLSDRAHAMLKTTTKFVEAVTDQEFTIKVAVRSPYTFTSDALSVWVHADGSKVDSFLVRGMDYRISNKNSSNIFRGPYVTGPGGTCQGSMKFAQINTVEHDIDSGEIKKLFERMSSTGELSIEFHRVHVFGSTPMVRAPIPLSNADYTAGVHEKALKGSAKSHGIILGATHPVDIRSAYKVHPIDGYKCPLLMFKFKYRSLEALKQLQIIERTPEPSPTPEVDLGLNLSDLSEEDRRELSRFAENLRKRKRTGSPKIKSEPNDEAVVNSKKRDRHSKENITIDLTADDEDDV